MSKTVKKHPDKACPNGRKACALCTKRDVVAYKTGKRSPLSDDFR